MLRMTIKDNIKVPNFDLSKELQFIAQQIIIPDISGRIGSGIDINGLPYPALAESTKKAKGGDDRPLIGKERLLFSSPYTVTLKGKNAVKITVKEVRREVADILQNQGVRSKKYGLRFFNFFGISEEASDLAVKHVRNKIIELTSGGKKST